MLHVIMLYGGKKKTQFQKIICIFGFAMAEENTGTADEITFQKQFLEIYLLFVEIN